MDALESEHPPPQNLKNINNKQFFIFKLLCSGKTISNISKEPLTPGEYWHHIACHRMVCHGRMLQADLDQLNCSVLALNPPALATPAEAIARSRLPPRFIPHYIPFPLNPECCQRGSRTPFRSQCTVGSTPQPSADLPGRPFPQFGGRGAPVALTTGEGITRAVATAMPRDGCAARPHPPAGSRLDWA